MPRPKKEKVKLVTIGCSLAPIDKQIFDAVTDYMKGQTWHEVTNAFAIRECIIRTALDYGVIKRDKSGVFKFANKTITPTIPEAIAQADA